MAERRDFRIFGLDAIGQGIATAGIALALALVLAGLAVRGGLQAYACGSNPYLTFCGEWVRDVPR